MFLHFISVFIQACVLDDQICVLAGYVFLFLNIDEVTQFKGYSS